METQDLVSGTLTEEDNSQILTALKLIADKLPFLVALSAEQRKQLRTAATKRQGYIQNVAAAVKSFPNELPSTYNASEFLAHSNLQDALANMFNQISVLFSNVTDTRMQLSSQLMKKSDIAYRYLKAGSKNNSQLKTVVENISTAFKGQGKKKMMSLKS